MPKGLGANAISSKVQGTHSLPKSKSRKLRKNLGETLLAPQTLSARAARSSTKNPVRSVGHACGHGIVLSELDSSRQVAAKVDGMCKPTVALCGHVKVTSTRSLLSVPYGLSTAQVHPSNSTALE